LKIIIIIKINTSFRLLGKKRKTFYYAQIIIFISTKKIIFSTNNLNMLSHLEPTAVWQNFELLNAVPRASKKEKEIIAYVKAFGNNLNLFVYEDEVGNLIIKKPASIGLENKPTICLQGHLDMVHQKNNDTVFDFATEGIKMYIDGDWVKAKGTTLGADNGLGVAAILAKQLYILHWKRYLP
jgi:hypothetical protein